MGQLNFLDMNPPAGKANGTVLPEDLPRIDGLRAKLLAHLQEHRTATTGELVRAVSHRFGGRLEELRKAGYVIDKERMADGQWLYAYRGHRDDLA